MTKDDLKGGLNSMRDRLAELETDARKLQNQNLADIVASAKGKLHQLVGHPDLELVAEKREMPFDPNAGGSAEHGGSSGSGTAERPSFDPRAGAARAVDSSGGKIGGPDRGKPDTFVPGDPRFNEQNRDFRQPNAVDLNPDGTLRQAPNSHGAARDVRE